MNDCDPARSLLPSHSTAQVTRVVSGEREVCADHLAEEAPVALVYNGISHAVMLATPEHLADLALGFSLSEGILESPDELYDVEVLPACDGVEVRMEVSSRRFSALKERRRTLAGRTGCGLCGVESLQAVARADGKRVTPLTLDPALVGKAMAEMQSLQPLHRLTGGVHGVAWVGLDGKVIAVREDVGRHNALDKLIGHMAKNDIAPASGFVLTSSRASYEMVQKAAMVGMGALAAVSAPTALAVRLAEETGLTLAGFVRGERLVIYHQAQ